VTVLIAHLMFTTRVSIRRNARVWNCRLSMMLMNLAVLLLFHFVTTRNAEFCNMIDGTQRWNKLCFFDVITYVGSGDIQEQS